jgi:FtsH-binding integral membrane protein
VVGLVIAPLILLGGPLVVRAAACTAGVVASLSLTAACAPSDKFLSWGGPLALGLGGIFVASIGK